MCCNWSADVHVSLPARSVGGLLLAQREPLEMVIGQHNSPSLISSSSARIKPRKWHFSVANETLKFTSQRVVLIVYRATVSSLCHCAVVTISPRWTQYNRTEIRPGTKLLNRMGVDGWVVLGNNNNSRRSSLNSSDSNSNNISSGRAITIP